VRNVRSIIESEVLLHIGIDVKTVQMEWMKAGGQRQSREVSKEQTKETLKEDVEAGTDVKIFNPCT
jgi:hypothetical protein